MTISQIIFMFGGGAEMAKALDVVPSAVSNAVVRGAFPAAWYAAVKSKCDHMGVDCPMALFSFKRQIITPTTEDAA